MNIPNDLYYTKDHEWVRIDGNTAVIGITDHAQGELGDVVYIDIPNPNESVAVHEVFGTIEAVKTVADLFAPLSGEIIEFNSDLNDAPDTVNNDCYGNGWIVKINISNPSEIDNLLGAAAYKELIGG